MNVRIAEQFKWIEQVDRASLSIYLKMFFQTGYILV